MITNDKYTDDYPALTITKDNYKGETYKCNHYKTGAEFGQKYNCDKMLVPIISERNKIILLNSSKQELESILKKHDECIHCKNIIKEYLYYFESSLFYTEKLKADETKIASYRLKNLVTYKDLKLIHPLLINDEKWSMYKFNSEIIKFYHPLDMQGLGNWLNLSFPPSAIIYALSIINKAKFASICFIERDIEYVRNICIYVHDKHEMIMNAQDKVKRLLKINFSDCAIIVLDYFCLF